MRTREHLEELEHHLSGVAAVAVEIFQTLAPEEPLPRRLEDYVVALKHAPALIGWWKRSSCRQGVTLAFTLALAHHPDINIPEIAAGFPAGTNAVSEAVVERLLESASTYAGMVERVMDMDDFMPTMLTDQEEAKGAMSRDFESTTPFADAAVGRLFTLAPEPVPKEENQEEDQEASSAAPPS
jgi:hypothetical protein